MNNQVRRNKLFVSLLAIVMVLAMIPSMAFAANFDNDQDRISIGSGEGLTLQWANTTTNTATAVPTNDSYNPSQFTLWVQNASATPTVTSGTGTITEAYETVEDNVAYNVTVSTAATIKVVLNNAAANSGVYYVNIPAPKGTKPAAGNPTAVNGYLPVGQFASGKAWGSLFTDGDNLTGTTKKFLGGYSATGVSLGAAGGYVDFDMRVSNDSSNPYGVDFIVYGNAFKGNPEAGSVKVYGFTGKDDTNGKWYELAGSLYYDDITQRNKDVSYKKGSDGIYYQITNHGAALTDSGWKKFNTNTSVAWWPEDSEGYDKVWGPVDDVTKTSDVITYKGVSIVKDTDTTNDYQFGYADVHVNGSNYGTAINPYTATDTSQGGDGFDLAWAVDENGEPVVLDHITKVRVYTSAGMMADGTNAFTTPSIFGETSAEVCGVYGVNGSGSGAGTAPTVKRGTSAIRGIQNLGTKVDSVPAGTYTYNVTGGDNVYINGVKQNSITVTVGANETKYVQIISQSGTASPFVTLLKVTGK